LATETPENNTESTSAAKQAGKGHATPTRKEREAANKRPLVPTDRKLAAKEARAANAAARERARVGLAAGDERYLPARDKGPQKKFARDWVDARFSIGELLIPIMLVIILISFIQVPGSDPYIVANIANGIMWIFVAVLLVDVMIMSARMKSRMVKKFGAVERGVRWYAMMRTLQMRFMRMPKPQVARKQFPS
jgi:hypothetical protein